MSFAIQHKTTGEFWAGLSRSGDDCWVIHAVDAVRFAFLTDATLGAMEEVDAPFATWDVVPVAGTPSRRWGRSIDAHLGAEERV
jgi:hypothetical protein